MVVKISQCRPIPGLQAFDKIGFADMFFYLADGYLFNGK